MKRRAGEEFRQHAGVGDAGTVQQLIANAREQLQLVQRQAIVYTLFARKNKSIMVCLPSPQQLLPLFAHNRANSSQIRVAYMHKIFTFGSVVTFHNLNMRCAAGSAGMEGG